MATPFVRVTITRFSDRGTHSDHHTVSAVQARYLVTDYIRNNKLTRDGDYQAGRLVDGDTVVGRYSITPA